MNITQRRSRRRAQAHRRVRSRVSGTAERPRLAVFKSRRFIYAQLIDDGAGRTLMQANSREEAVRSQLKSESTSSKAAARLVGREIAERAGAGGINRCVFDRGGYRYHGRVKVLADAVRESGLDF